jgi:hypothetical protein
MATSYQGIGIILATLCKNLQSCSQSQEKFLQLLTRILLSLSEAFAKTQKAVASKKEELGGSRTQEWFLIGQFLLGFPNCNV